MKGLYLLPGLLVAVYLSIHTGCAIFTPNVLVEKWSEGERSMKDKPWELNFLRIHTPEGSEDLRETTEDLLEVFIRKHNEDTTKGNGPIYLSVHIEEGSLFYGHRMTNTLTIRVGFYPTPSSSQSSTTPLGVVVVTRESEKSIMSGKELMKMLKKTIQEVP